MSHNGIGSEPKGYRAEMRLNDSESWTSGPEIDHNRMATTHTVFLENLQPRKYYYVRITPFIEEKGLAYYGTPTQEGGPFLTTDDGRWLYSPTVRPSKSYTSHLIPSDTFRAVLNNQIVSQYINYLP